MYAFKLLNSSNTWNTSRIENFFTSRYRRALLVEGRVRVGDFLCFSFFFFNILIVWSLFIWDHETYLLCKK